MGRAGGEGGGWLGRWSRNDRGEHKCRGQGGSHCHQSSSEVRGCPRGREWSLLPQGILGDLCAPEGNGGGEATWVLLPRNVKLSKVSPLLGRCGMGCLPNTSYKSHEGPGNKARGAHPGNLTLQDVPTSLVDLRGWLPPNNPRLPHQLGQDCGSPSSAPTAPQPSNPGVRETKSRGRPRRRGGQGPQAQLKWPVGGTRPSLQTGRKSTRGRSLWALGLHLRPTTSLPASPFPESPALGRHRLKPSSSAGGHGTCRSVVEKTWGWNQRDLIKALTACRAVTRYGGQPEKVDIYLCPHLTYRPVPAWRVVSGTARGNRMARTMAPLSSDSL